MEVKVLANIVNQSLDEQCNPDFTKNVRQAWGNNLSQSLHNQKHLVTVL